MRGRAGAADFDIPPRFRPLYANHPPAMTTLRSRRSRSYRLFAFLALALSLLATPTYAQQVELVEDINPGADDSSPGFLTGFVELGSYLYFRADDGVHGEELWRTDGSTTERVEDINPGADGLGPSGFTVFGDYLYFRADDGTTGRELWRTDGITTERVADINPGPDDSGPGGFAVFEGALYFAADDGVHGREPWVLRVPEEALGEIVETVIAFDLPHGLTNSLLAKLNKALADIEAGNFEDALAKLNAFINQVQAQRGKKLTEAEADELIAQAEALIALLEAELDDGNGGAVRADLSVPDVFALEAAYPNPFRAAAAVAFALPERAAVSLVVYDVLGREVARLAEGTFEAGRHTVRFDAAGLPSGTYLVRFEAGGVTQTQRVLLVR